MGSFIHVYTDGGGIREARVPDDFSGMDSMISILRFPGFRKSLLASLASSGNVASRTSNIVTITATSHGVTTGSTFVGFRFFYPGSASLAAGWYESITDVTTNTISFNAAGSDFGSESVNGGAAYITDTTFCTAEVQPSYMSIYGTVIVAGMWGGDTAITKNQRVKVGATFFVTKQTSTVPSVEVTATVRIGDDLQTQYVTAADNATTTNLTKLSQNFAVPINVGLSGNVAAAGGFLTLYGGEVRIIR